MTVPSRPEPLDGGWSPDPVLVSSLRIECEQHGVNLDRLIRRFRLYYTEKQARFRSWDSKLEEWVLRDIEQAERDHPRHVTDEMGMASWQRHPRDRGVSEEEQEELARLASIIEAEKERARQTR